MPWEHCGQTVPDNSNCPSCGHYKESRTVQFDKTRLFVLGGEPWEGDGEAQAQTLKTAHQGAAPFCEP